MKTKKNPRPDHPLLLICGDGKTLKADVLRFIGWSIPHDAMCIGRSMLVYPFHVKHYVDVDCDAGKWNLENLTTIYPQRGTPITHTLGFCDWVDVCWDSDELLVPAEDVRWHGSTALFAALIAKDMGYKVVVLAGCPMDKAGHWYFEDQAGPNWGYSDLEAWIEFSQSEKSLYVASMSGYTAKIVGVADRDWIRWALSLPSNQLER